MKYSIALWVIWYVYWLISARNRVRGTNSAPAQREPWAGRAVYLSLLLVGFLLLLRSHPLFAHDRTPWKTSIALPVAGLFIQAAGLSFAIWARYTLGKNWSARIATASSQDLIVRGPYRIVRHPIYSGLIFAMLGTAFVSGWIHALIGMLIATASVIVKIRREEAALRQHFGPSYSEYAVRVPALLPSWPGRS